MIKVCYIYVWNWEIINTLKNKNKAIKKCLKEKIMYFRLNLYKNLGMLNLKTIDWEIMT